MVKKLTFLLLCLGTEIACIDESNANEQHETRVLTAVVRILRRESLPKQDFREWCKESSEVLSASKKVAFQRLGSSLDDIHKKTDSLASTAALVPFILSTINKFVDAVKHHEPDFTLSWWEIPFVAPHVTPWAYKSILQSNNEETK